MRVVCVWESDRSATVQEIERARGAGGCVQGQARTKGRPEASEPCMATYNKIKVRVRLLFPKEERHVLLRTE